MIGLLRRRTTPGLVEQTWKTEEVGRDRFLLIDLPPRAGSVEVHARAASELTAELVLEDGQVVPVGKGLAIEYKGNAGGAVKISLTAKPGTAISYMAFATRQAARYEYPDPTPISVTERTAVSPGIPKVVRDYIAELLEAKGIGREITKDVLEDLTDAEFDWSDEDIDVFERFGPGRLVDEEPVKRAEPVPGPAPASPAPSPGPAAAPPPVAST